MRYAQNIYYVLLAIGTSSEAAGFNLRDLVG
jgi:hypothetical protein